MSSQFRACLGCSTARAADPEYQTRLEAKRCTLEFRQPSPKKLDGGQRPIEESPLFGGGQQPLFSSRDE